MERRPGPPPASGRHPAPGFSLPPRGVERSGGSIPAKRVAAATRRGVGRHGNSVWRNWGGGGRPTNNPGRRAAMASPRRSPLHVDAGGRGPAAANPGTGSASVSRPGGGPRGATAADARLRQPHELSDCRTDPFPPPLRSPGLRGGRSEASSGRWNGRASARPPAPAPPFITAWLACVWRRSWRRTSSMPASSRTRSQIESSRLRGREGSRGEGNTKGLSVLGCLLRMVRAWELSGTPSRPRFAVGQNQAVRLDLGPAQPEDFAPCGIRSTGAAG